MSIHEHQSRFRQAVNRLTRTTDEGAGTARRTSLLQPMWLVFFGLLAAGVTLAWAGFLGWLVLRLFSWLTAFF